MRHKNETRPAYEMRKEHIAAAAMVLLCLPIFLIYVSFFSQAFFVDGHFSAQNFHFLRISRIIQSPSPSRHGK